MSFVYRSLLGAVALSTLLTGAAAPVAAHHSFAVFDFSTQIPFEGVVETLNFKNPHIAMTLRHTKPDGTTEIIEFIEGAPANMLVRQGLSPDLIVPGTRITAFGSPLREDPSKYFLRNVRLEDGREFPTGAPQ